MEMEHRYFPYGWSDTSSSSLASTVVYLVARYRAVKVQCACTLNNFASFVVLNVVAGAM